MPMLRFSEVQRERAKLGVVDSCVTYGYVPNVFDYHQSVVQKDISDGDQK